MLAAMLFKTGLRVFWRKFGLNGNFALPQWFGQSAPTGLYHAIILICSGFAAGLFCRTIQIFIAE